MSLLIRSSRYEGPFAGKLIGGRYRPVRTMGRGAHGLVLEAEDTVASGPVAVKLLAGREWEQQARFEREAELLMRLHHPHIVGATDQGREEGTPYLVMELVKGHTVAEAAEGCSRDLRRIAGWIRQAAEGLQHAHAHGVVHRDIKPQNVLVRDDGVVKLVDFGLARPLAGPALTPSGVLLGTALYLPPEQTLSADVGSPADVYALGVTLFELCTGRLPFVSNDQIAVALMHCGEPPPRPRSLNPAICGSMEALILSMLAKSPDRRPDAGAVARTLAALGGEQALPQGGPIGTAPPPLIGRRIEMARLQGCIRSWQEGRSGVVWIQGPPGSGKTRLLTFSSGFCELLGLKVAGRPEAVGASPGRVMLVDDADALPTPDQAALRGAILAGASLVGTVTEVPSWSARSDVITLRPLGRRAARELLRAGGLHLMPEQVSRLIERSGGWPGRLLDGCQVPGVDHD